MSKSKTKAEFPEYEIRAVDDLIPYARNSRTHSDEQVAQIAASIREFGFTNPVLIDENDGIIAGHGRVLAAQRLDLDKIPAVKLTNLSEAQKRAYIIADNKLALNAGWDDELLKLEFDDLAEAGFDLDFTGFSFEEVQDIRQIDNEASINPPDDFGEVDEENLDHKCPKCGFEFDE